MRTMRIILIRVRESFNLPGEMSEPCQLNLSQKGGQLKQKGCNEIASDEPECQTKIMDDSITVQRKFLQARQGYKK